MQSLKYLGIYFLGIISLFLFNELLNLFSDSNTFLFLLIDGSHMLIGLPLLMIL